MEVGNSEGQQTHRREIVTKKHLNDMYVALSCFHSLMHAPKRRKSSAAVFTSMSRHCTHDIAPKMFPKYAFGAFFRLQGGLYINIKLRQINGFSVSVNFDEIAKNR